MSARKASRAYFPSARFGAFSTRWHPAGLLGALMTGWRPSAPLGAPAPVPGAPTCRGACPGKGLVAHARRFRAADHGVEFGGKDRRCSRFAHDCVLPPAAIGLAASRSSPNVPSRCFGADLDQCGPIASCQHGASRLGGAVVSGADNARVAPVADFGALFAGIMVIMAGEDDRER